MARVTIFDKFEFGNGVLLLIDVIFMVCCIRLIAMQRHLPPVPPSGVAGITAKAPD